MREIALFTGLIGILFLIMIINFYPSMKVNSQKDIDPMIENQKVTVSGKVIDTKKLSTYYILSLDTNITLYCYCDNLPNLIGKKVSVEGVIDTFQKNKIKILKIAY